MLSCLNFKRAHGNSEISLSRFFVCDTRAFDADCLKIEKNCLYTVDINRKKFSICLVLLVDFPNNKILMK